MDTRIVKIEEDNIDQTVLIRAGEIIKSGGLVAFPTETVYGLGGDALNGTSSRKIYAAKGRPSDNPETTGGLSTVAVRMPSNKIARALIEASGGYVAAPSANRSGRPSPTLAKYVAEDLDGRVDMIIDGGAAEIGLESTIVDFTEENPVILRPGYITEEMIRQAMGCPAGRKTVSGAGDDGEETGAPKAPGMKYRHYAPRGSLTIVEGKKTRLVSDFICRELQGAKAEGKKTGVIATDETAEVYPADSVKSVGKRADEAEIAKSLFRILSEFDDEEIQVIYAESFDVQGVGQAIMNRLLKAAGNHVVHV